MTSTSSAIDTGLSADRRLIVSGAALASLVAITAAAPAAATERPGPVETAHGTWFRAARAADDAVLATWAAEERYKAPARPAWHPTLSAGGYEMVRRPNGKCSVYLSDTPANIAELQAIINAPIKPDPEDIETSASHGLRVEKARATLDKIEAWQRECRQRADACGLTAAREHETPLIAAAHQARTEGLALVPESFREAAFQAAILTMEWDETAAARLLERLVELAGIPSYFEEA